MIVGKRLKEARKKEGFSQEELGERLNLSKSAISLYESEKRCPKIETIIELMYILGVTADHLLGTDVVVEVKKETAYKYRTLTKEEMQFITELRKDKSIHESLLTDPKRGLEIIKKYV